MQIFKCKTCGSYLGPHGMARHRQIGTHHCWDPAAGGHSKCSSNDFEEINVDPESETDAPGVGRIKFREFL